MITIFSNSAAQQSAETYEDWYAKTHAKLWGELESMRVSYGEGYCTEDRYFKKFHKKAKAAINARIPNTEKNEVLRRKAYWDLKQGLEIPMTGNYTAEFINRPLG